MTRKPTQRPLVVAHRGSSGTAPENTMIAFRIAAEAGADMIELDVRMTKDFHLVVHHDQNVRRTTNGSGHIWDKTLEELRTLDAGSWFSAKFKGERIPTLRQVMEMLPPHVMLNIEAKSDGDPRKYNHFEESCILIIMEKKFEERALVSSFDHKFLARIHALYPTIKTGALYVPIRDAAKTPSSLARKIGTSAFICGRTQMRKRYVEDARAHNITTACYVVNTAPHLSAMLRYGVDAMVTDYPERILRMLKKG
ncbi:MAG: Glycerophosphodiester phosphodiesterase [Bacteroidetes bacterium]|nr:Glycerophosphodiester phosphodiesterase [Bacteroidota bacterium]